MSTKAARARATPAAVVPGARRTSAVACQARWPAGVAAWLPDHPSRSRAARFVSRRMARTLRTVRVQAFGCPIRTTSWVPRATDERVLGLLETSRAQPCAGSN
jgi:hypothetical protein